MDRRELLGLLGGTGLASLSPGQGPRLDGLIERLRRRISPYRFKALNPHQAATVTALADAIIPPTDTPGAAEAGVPAFIDVIVGEWYDETERTQFLDGLAELDRRSEAEGGPFVELDEQAKVVLLSQVEAEAFARRAAEPDAPTPFWLRFKSLTIYGYYHSPAGSLQELDRPVIPGRFIGCEPLPPARPGAL